MVAAFISYEFSQCIRFLLEPQASLLQFLMFLFMSEENKEIPEKLPELLTAMDSDLLKRYTTGTGKILPRKYTGLSAKQQRHVARVIKRGRNILTTL